MVGPPKSLSAELFLGIEMPNIAKPGRGDSMFPGVGCGPMSVGGWVLVGLFWATFLGLVLWALSRLFPRSRGGGGLHGDADNLDLRFAREQMYLSRTEAGAANSPPQSVTEAGGQKSTLQPPQVRARSRAPD